MMMLCPCNFSCQSDNKIQVHVVKLSAPNAEWRLCWQARLGSCHVCFAVGPWLGSWDTSPCLSGLQQCQAACLCWQRQVELLTLCSPCCLDVQSQARMQSVVTTSAATCVL